MKKRILMFISSILLLIASIFSYNPIAFANPNDYTVEGDMTRFVTGNAYPTQILFTGYNATSDELYLNIEFEGGSSYNYVANIYHGNDAALWGTVTEAGIVDALTPIHEVANKKIIANVPGTDLKIQHRIVVTVTSYSP